MDLNRWLPQFRGPLVGLIASWGTPWQDAEELAQDTFAEAYYAWPRYEGDPDSDRAVGAWLRGIAFRLQSQWRKRRERAGLPLDDSMHDLPEGAPPYDDPRHEVLFDAIRRLPGKLRTVLWMRYLDENSVRDVACLLGDTDKSVESRLLRARRELKRLLLETGMTHEGRLER